jgi:hypothetical protein
MPDPFGLALGSTPESEYCKYNLSFRKVPNAHPDLVSYFGEWHPRHGLVNIIAASEEFEADPYGSAALKLYERLKQQLKSVYGECREIELVDPDGIYPEADDFLRAIEFGERVHAAQWRREDGSALDSGIEEIYLSIVSLEYDRSSVVLKYSKFTGDFEDPDTHQVGISAL